jgi:hypothetical protein
MVGFITLPRLIFRPLFLSGLFLFLLLLLGFFLRLSPALAHIATVTLVPIASLLLELRPALLDRCDWSSRRDRDTGIVD